MRRLAPWLVLVLTALAAAAAADAPPPPPPRALSIRGVGSSHTSDGDPGHAMFDVENRSDRAVRIQSPTIAVLDGSSHRPARVVRVTRGGQAIAGTITVRPRHTDRLTVFFEMPEPFRRGNRWQVVLSGRIDVPFDTLPAIITRAYRDPVPR